MFEKIWYIINALNEEVRNDLWKLSKKNLSKFWLVSIQK